MDATWAQVALALLAVAVLFLAVALGLVLLAFTPPRKPPLGPEHKKRWALRR